MTGLVCFSEIGTWRTPQNFIGPRYAVELAQGKQFVSLTLHQETLRLRLEHTHNRLEPQERLALFMGKTEIAFQTWQYLNNLSGVCLHHTRITEKAFRKTGLAKVLMNLALQAVYNQTKGLAGVSTTQTLADKDSSLAILGLFAEFGLDNYKSSRRDEILSAMNDTSNPLQVQKVEGEEIFYIHFFPTSWRAWSLATFKIFLLSGGDKALYDGLVRDRTRLEAVILQHQAYLSLPMCIDPEKVEIMERYVSQLPVAA